VRVRVSTYQVLSVNRREDSDELRGFELEAPRAGDEGEVHVLPIKGWVAARDTRPKAIEIGYHDRLLRTSPVWAGLSEGGKPLPEGTEQLGGRFHAFVGLPGLKLESELLLRAVLENEQRVPFASIAIRRRPLRTTFEPTIQPLILTSLERSGTTWLMKIFTSHPEIVVFRRFPYEHSPAKYWIHMLRVLSEPANLLESAHPDSFHGDPFWVGHNPFHDEAAFERPALERWIGRTYVERLAAFCQSSIEDWYATVARTQQQATPAYFAEKVWPSFLPVLTWELYPKAKEVLLVRDFRDVACSMLSFEARRGYAAFGRPDGKSDEDYIREELQAGALAMRNSWRSRNDRAHLVRYEDLMLRPAPTLTKLLEYLELDCSPALVDELLKQAAAEVPELPGMSTDPKLVEVHRTMPEAKDTVGRWKLESDDARTALYWDCFGEVLEEFGYPKAGLSEQQT
jgi:hypothetical protein